VSPTRPVAAQSFSELAGCATLRLRQGGSKDIGNTVQRRARSKVWRLGRAIVQVAILTILGISAAAAQTTAPVPPPTLGDTGLYSDAERLVVDPAHLGFAPQYPLWTDGAVKRRWISLPPGTAIDGSDPDAWVFPVGTRLWKEFAFDGRRVETRFIERRPEGWLFAAYEWSADGREAVLAPERGRRGAYVFEDGRAHTIPGASDCRVCHEAGPAPVIGFSLLQLAPDRDPAAPHAEPAGVDLDDLVQAGLLVGLPATERAPRIAAESAVERAALGYLHGNCGHCHNADGPLGKLGLRLRHSAGAEIAPAIATAVGQPVAKPAPGQPAEAVLRIEPGRPDRSAIVVRMASRYAALQMPPLGTELADQQALDLVRQWIAGMDDKYAQTKREGER
jgi:hypothetical protein